MEKKRNLILVISFFVGVALIIIVGLFINNSQKDPKNIESVNVIKDGQELKVNSDGSVVYTTQSGTFEDQWDKQKTDAYFDYFGSNYQGDTQTVRPGQNLVTVVINGITYTYILNDDEIVDAAADDATEPDNGGDTGNGGDDDGDISQFFSPTPSSTNSSNPTPTPTPYNGGGSPFAECLFWRLSYCVIPIPPSPTLGPSASPTPTGDPEANVIQVNNCGQYISEGNSKPTIINNTVCLPEE